MGTAYTGPPSGHGCIQVLLLYETWSALEQYAANRIRSGQQQVHDVGVDLVEGDVLVRQQVGQVDSVGVGRRLGAVAAEYLSSLIDQLLGYNPPRTQLAF